MIIQIYLSASEEEKLKGLADAEGMDIKKYAKHCLMSRKVKQEKKEFVSLVYKATMRALQDYSGATE